MSIALGRWFDPAEMSKAIVGGNNVPKTYQVLSLNQMPATCYLLGLHQGAEEEQERAGAVGGKLSALENELRRVESSIEAATTDTTTPEAFALALASRELLLRSIEKLRPQVELAQYGARVRWQARMDSTKDYEKIVGQFNRGVDEWGEGLTLAERNELENRINFYVGARVR